MAKKNMDKIREMMMAALEAGRGSMQNASNASRPPLKEEMAQKMFGGTITPQEGTAANIQQDQGQFNAMVGKAQEDAMNMNPTMGIAGAGSRATLQGMNMLRSMLSPERYQAVMRELQTMASKTHGPVEAQRAEVMDQLAMEAVRKLGGLGEQVGNKLGQAFMKKRVAMPQQTTARDWNLGELLAQVTKPQTNESALEEMGEHLTKYLTKEFGNEAFDNYMNATNRNVRDFGGNLARYDDPAMLEVLGDIPAKAGKLSNAFNKLNSYEKSIGGKGYPVSEREDVILDMVGDSNLTREQLQAFMKRFGLNKE